MRDFLIYALVEAAFIFPIIGWDVSRLLWLMDWPIESWMTALAFGCTAGAFARGAMRVAE